MWRVGIETFPINYRQQKQLIIYSKRRFHDGYSVVRKHTQRSLLLKRQKSKEILSVMMSLLVK